MVDALEDEIFARLRGRLVQTAEQRLARARTLLEAEALQGKAIASELHALAGEASLIGADEMADAARAAERAANAGDDARTRAAIHDVESALKRLA